MFDQEQIAEFKEAFNLIDYDHDGFIGKNDLEETYNSLGMLTIFKAFQQKNHVIAWRMFSNAKLYPCTATIQATAPQRHI